MSGHNGSIKAVIFALGSNILITIIKFVVSAITHSTAMMAEAVHSVADCGNQVFLLIGNKRASKAPSEQHPFGYGKEEYFWGFLVAVLLFFVGATFSIYEGVHKLFNPAKIESVGWSFAVLILSIFIESKSFHVAYVEFSKKYKGQRFFKAIRDSTDTNLFVILLEDSAALMGLSIVLISTILAWAVHPIFDAIGSICVGLLLVSISVFLINELRKLIVGENIPRELRRDLKVIVEKNPAIQKVNKISAMIMGKGRFLLVVSIDLTDNSLGSAIEDQLNEIRKDLTQFCPEILSIYFDIRDLKRDTH